MDITEITEIAHYQTDHFEIKFIDLPKTSWCIDGEEYKEKTDTFVFRVEQNMKMQIPKENIQNLFEE